jgi:hypothetical protein
MRPAEPMTAISGATSDEISCDIPEGWPRRGFSPQPPRVSWAPMRDDPLRALRDTRRAEKRGESLPPPERPRRSLVTQGGRSSMPSFAPRVSIDDAIRRAIAEMRERPLWTRL